MGLPNNFPRREQTEHFLPLRVLRGHHRTVCGKIRALLVHVGALGLAAHHGRRDRHHQGLRCFFVFLLQSAAVDHVEESVD